MRPLGRVRHVSKSGRLIVEASEVPPIGAKVLDERMNFIGTVYDIMGPVSRPFVSVKVDESRFRPESLVGRLVFWEGPRRRARKRRR